MRIGIDANEANVSHRVGSNVYAFEVLTRLYRQGNQHQFTIYLAGAPLADLPRPKANWQYRVINPGFFWTQWRLPLDLLIHRPRPVVFLTLGHYAPRFSPIPIIICIMDLAFLKFPETFRKRDLYKLTAWTRYSVKQASQIFAISQATKQDIINSYGFAADKISVAYPGIDKLQATGKSPVSGKYLLYIGTLQPRKNIEALIEACKDGPCRLVIAGKLGWKYKIKSAPQVKYLGYVPQDRLAGLIKGSQGLVLPSLYEGFGIPVVQAMSLGVPVLVSRNSSLTEIVGDAGLYIEPPFDSAAIRVGLNKLLNLTSAQKQSLVVSARQQVAQFTWEKTAKIILKSIFERYGRTH
ncbi:hypothetical protein AUJ59_01045 [Candidatus Beckwithbacteria bacterium CG1_02_47_37]|nr:MAG: hypothetical protein AUJ59_01045 [Candidatus Beckwithbacteria bacterium CG1_02_47_37]